MFILDVDRETMALVRALPPARKSAIKAALTQIRRTPHAGKPLQNELKGLYAYRVGRLRIVYAVNRSERRVHVIAIGPRSTIYENIRK